jgi:hypothetical protein
MSIPCYDCDAAGRAVVGGGQRLLIQRVVG